MELMDHVLWRPTPVFLLGESHGERKLAVYSPRGCKELDTTEATKHAHTHMLVLFLIFEEPP